MRQRRTVDYSHRYTITSQDVHRAKVTAEDHEKHAAPEIADVNEVMDGFDPHNCVKDRRLLYEVTGKRMFASEFVDDESSGEDWYDEDMDDLACFHYVASPINQDSMQDGRSESAT